MTYPEKVDARPYARRLREMPDELKATYGYSEVDALLVLKDILAKTWDRKKS